MRKNHVGIVCRSVEKKAKTYEEQYGYRRITSVLTVENQGVRVLLLNNGIDYCSVELIEPMGETSPVSGFLKRGGGFHHICYETDQFELLLEKFKTKIVQPPKPAPQEYFKGGRTFFIFKEGELLEFLEIR